MANYAPIYKAVMAPPKPPVKKGYSLFKWNGILYHDLLDCCQQNLTKSPDEIQINGYRMRFATKEQYYNYIAQHAQNNYQQQKEAAEARARKPVRFLNKEPASSQS
jgi:hypothetical protein